MPWEMALWYFIVINVLACVLTVWDKKCARRGKRRVPERALFTVAAFGGAVGMLATMRLIRHKTRYRRFMSGLPLIIILQGILVCAIASTESDKLERFVELLLDF